MSGDPLAALAMRAMDLITNGSTIGLGSGRAALAFVEVLAREIQRGLSVRGVPTSEETARRARELGIPLVELGEAELDVTMDGADEVDPDLNLLKGAGGALARERIVAAASRRQIILVGADKLVPALGTRARLPVEVIPFAAAPSRRRLRELGYKPELRRRGAAPFVTDNGNVILDCETGPLTDPAAVERAIRAIPGVVDTGLFLGTAETVLVADGDTVRVLSRKGKS